jgi:hypothetical protein
VTLFSLSQRLKLAFHLAVPRKNLVLILKGNGLQKRNIPTKDATGKYPKISCNGLVDALLEFDEPASFQFVYAAAKRLVYSVNQACRDI